MNQSIALEYLTQAAVLMGHGRFDEAQHYFEKAELENPLEPKVFLMKGIALANQGNINEARIQFEKVLKLDQFFAEAYFHLGNIAVLEGDIEQGLEKFSQALANGFDDAQIFFNIGLLHEEKEDVDAAIRNYNIGIVKDSARFDIRMRKIELFINSGRLQDALVEVEKIILLTPEIPDGYKLKLSILQQMERYAEAEKFLKSTMSQFSKNPDFVFEYARLKVFYKDYDSALDILTKIEQEFAVEEALSRKILLTKAQIAADKSDVKKAIVLLKNAKEDSDKQDRFDDEVYFLLANCYISVGDYQETLTCSREIMQKSNDEYYKMTARYFEPFSLNQLGKADEAIRLYKQAIDEYRSYSLEHPGNLDPYLLRVLCLRDLGQFDKALELLDYVIILEPEKVEPKMLKMDILDKKGYKKEAEEEKNSINALLPKHMQL